MHKYHEITALNGDEVEVRIPADCAYSVCRIPEGAVMKITKIGSRKPIDKPIGGYNSALGCVEGSATPSRGGVKVFHVEARMNE